MELSAEDVEAKADREGVKLELDRLREFGVYEDRPAAEAAGQKHVTTKWEKSWKYDPKTDKWFVRARFVAREFKWCEWRDDLFAPSAGHSTHRLIDYVALREGHVTFTADASNAYFHVPETEVVYVDPPEEYVQQLRDEGKPVDIKRRLRKQLYGRRKAAQLWMQHMAGVLVELGFNQCEAAPQFFYAPVRNIALELHMDDIHGCGSKPDVEQFLTELATKIRLKHDIMEADGREYQHLKRTRVRHTTHTEIRPNPKYVEKVREQLGMTTCNPAPTPSVEAHRAERGQPGDEPLGVDGHKLFRTCVGSLAYFALDRDDVQYEVNMLAQDLAAPTASSMKRLKRLVRYLSGTMDMAVVMRRPFNTKPGVATLNVYSDSDWAGDTLTRRSQSSVHIEVDGCPLHGASRRQNATATSSAEAEYYAACAALSEAIHIREVLVFFGYEVVMRLLMDSSAARGICRREGVGRVKHLETKCLWVQQYVKKKIVKVSDVPTADNKADLGTKTLSAARLEHLRRICGLMRHSVADPGAVASLVESSVDTHCVSAADRDRISWLAKVLLAIGAPSAH